MYTKFATLSSVYRDNLESFRPKPVQHEAQHNELLTHPTSTLNHNRKPFGVQSFGPNRFRRRIESVESAGESNGIQASGSTTTTETRLSIPEPPAATAKVKPAVTKVKPKPVENSTCVGSDDERHFQSVCCSVFQRCCRRKVHRVGHCSLECIPTSQPRTEEVMSLRAKLCRRFTPSSVVLPASGYHYAWLVVISIAILYNIIIVIARMVFAQLESQYLPVWFTLDYLCDALYLVDILVRFRTGFLENGLVVRDSKKLAKNYIKSVGFKFDVVSILPTDFFYLIGLNTAYYPGWRLNRLLRFSRLREFFDRTIRRTSYPNVFRILNLVLYILIIVHWNACFYYALSGLIGYGTDGWVYPNATTSDMDRLSRKYVYSFYWSTLTLLTIGETPHPEKDIEYAFVVADFLVGVLIFATIVGNVGSMITNMNHHSSVFTQKLDGVKRYMKIRKVTHDLEKKVINWFDYLWTNKESLDDDGCLLALPEQLRSEIAMDVHMEALKQAKVFQDCAAGEEGLLKELVLKLKSQVFSPGDYVCLLGDIGREMYIVKEGQLEVQGADRVAYATLEKGAVFGEISILEIPGSKIGNRRMANVMSVGYSSCLILSKSDLWGLLKDYPKARDKLYEKGRDLLALDDMLSKTETAPVEYADTSMYDAAEMIRSMEEQLNSLEDKVGAFISTYTTEKQELRTKVERLERLMDCHSHSPMPKQLRTTTSTPSSQSQIHTSISVTHLKTPNSCNRCATTLTCGCKTQLSLSVENLEYENKESGRGSRSNNSNSTQSTRCQSNLSRTVHSVMSPNNVDTTSVSLSTSSPGEQK